VPLVWDALFWLPAPRSLRANALQELYRGASGECPVIEAPQSPPCASGRFGCSVCTVVRKDKSAMELVRSGKTESSPFLQFRDWLAQFRNDPGNRWPTRRNGSEGVGLFTLKARKEILRRIDLLEIQTRTIILDSAERGLIARMWELDHHPRLSFRVSPRSHEMAEGAGNFRFGAWRRGSTKNPRSECRYDISREHKSVITLRCQLKMTNGRGNYRLAFSLRAPDGG
jgi:hypothetical protein